MANEIRIATRLQLWRDSVMIRNTPLTEIQIATTSDLFSDNTQTVGTSHEQLDVGDVTDDAVVIIENLHATAIVEVGGDATGAFVSWITIPPGYPPAILPKASALADVYLKSDTATTQVRVTMAKIAA